jgi:hypothetical protein
VTTISEDEFARIVRGIAEDRESIIKHNPIGPPDEILLWMLLSCLISYLNLTEIETPCYNGKPDADTYRKAVLFVIDSHAADKFDANRYLDEML